MERSDENPIMPSMLTRDAYNIAVQQQMHYYMQNYVLEPMANQQHNRNNNNNYSAMNALRYYAQRVQNNDDNIPDNSMNHENNITNYPYLHPILPQIHELRPRLNYHDVLQLNYIGINNDEFYDESFNDASDESTDESTDESSIDSSSEFNDVDDNYINVEDSDSLDESNVFRPYSLPNYMQPDNVQMDNMINHRNNRQYNPNNNEEINNDNNNLITPMRYFEIERLRRSDEWSITSDEIDR